MTESQSLVLTLDLFWFGLDDSEEVQTKSLENLDVEFY
jgi:hypothetical protein